MFYNRTKRINDYESYKGENNIEWPNVKDKDLRVLF